MTSFLTNYLRLLEIEKEEFKHILKDAVTFCSGITTALSSFDYEDDAKADGLSPNGDDGQDDSFSDGVDEDGAPPLITPHPHFVSHPSVIPTEAAEAANTSSKRKKKMAKITPASSSSTSAAVPLTSSSSSSSSIPTANNMLSSSHPTIAMATPSLSQPQGRNKSAKHTANSAATGNHPAALSHHPPPAATNPVIPASVPPIQDFAIPNPYAVPPGYGYIALQYPTTPLPEQLQFMMYSDHMQPPPPSMPRTQRP